tara:strand:+ start:475 stop:897 length:423 start_codon:yes stop_codon:yes gene_type:complete
MRISQLQLQRCELIPNKLSSGTLYVSKKYQTAVHLCCCGCKEEVVTPLSAVDWTFTIKQGGPSLSPSIGNWSFPCRSHYWVIGGRVQWAGDMSKTRIKKIQEADRQLKNSYIQHKNQQHSLIKLLTRFAKQAHKWLKSKL